MAAEIEKVLADFKAGTDRIVAKPNFQTPVWWALCNTPSESGEGLVFEFATTNEGDDLNLGSFTRIWANSLKTTSLDDGVVAITLDRRGLSVAADELQPVVDAMPDKSHENYHALRRTAENGVPVIVVAVLSYDVLARMVQEVFGSHLNK